MLYCAALLTTSMVIGCGDRGNPVVPTGDAGRDAGSEAGGSPNDVTCRSDADCKAPLPFCAPKGYCVACISDANCSPAARFCNPFGFFCEACHNDADCPAEFPACEHDWEYSHAYCAQCRLGSPNHCPSGQWCKCSFLCFPQAQGGRCTEHHCATAPIGADCVECRDVNSGPCFDAGGACESALGALKQCYDAAVPGGTCELRKRAYRQSCVPDACRAEVQRVDACLETCDALNALCD